MRHYEIVVLVGAEQHERGTAMAQRYQDMITEGGGGVHRFEDWGSRRLAYPIGRRQRARYFLFNVECDSDTLNKLKDDFRYSESVIRSLVIRRKQAVVDESLIMLEMKAKADDEASSEGAAAASDDAGAVAAEAPPAADTDASPAAPAPAPDTPAQGE